MASVFRILKFITAKKRTASGEATPVRAYYMLTKPGIVYGNSFTAGAGFILGAQVAGTLPLSTGIAMLAGIALVMASGCVFNNYMDRGIDAKMTRTKKRALVHGDISGTHALVFATCLGIAGSLCLALTNWLTVAVALAGLYFYVVVYGYFKRASVHGTVVGSISGAVPPVVGYTAVTGRLDLAAASLFAILVCWQMPHFYAIAMFRKDDYAAANIPVLPVKQGFATTKRYIMAYIVLFIGAVLLPTAFGYTGYTYAGIMAALGLYWLVKGIAGFHTANAAADVRWARTMFFTSLLVLPALPVALLANTILP